MKCCDCQRWLQGPRVLLQSPSAWAHSPTCTASQLLTSGQWKEVESFVKYRQLIMCLTNSLSDWSWGRGRVDLHVDSQAGPSDGSVVMRASLWLVRTAYHEEFIYTDRRLRESCKRVRWEPRAEQFLREHAQGWNHSIWITQVILNIIPVVVALLD